MALWFIEQNRCQKSGTFAGVVIVAEIECTTAALHFFDFLAVNFLVIFGELGSNAWVKL